MKKKKSGPDILANSSGLFFILCMGLGTHIDLLSLSLFCRNVIPHAIEIKFRTMAYTAACVDTEMIRPCQQL